MSFPVALSNITEYDQIVFLLLCHSNFCKLTAILKRGHGGPQQIAHVLLCDSQALLGLFVWEFKTTHSWLPFAPMGARG